MEGLSCEPQGSARTSVGVAMNESANRSSARGRQTTYLAEVAGRHGPGLITGASDDDPSGIATYSQAGVQFAYSMGWTGRCCLRIH